MVRSFNEIFEVELECWCYGLSNTKEKVDLKVLHRVIREFSGVFHESIEHHYAFDVIDTAKKLIKSSYCKASEKEIAFYILSTLPIPAELSKEQNKILSQIVQQVEDQYGGAFDRLSKKWNSETINLSKISLNPKPDSFDQLYIPSKSFNK